MLISRTARALPGSISMPRQLVAILSRPRYPPAIQKSRMNFVLSLEHARRFMDDGLRHDGIRHGPSFSWIQEPAIARHGAEPFGPLGNGSPPAHRPPGFGSPRGRNPGDTTRRRASHGRR